MKDLDDLMSFEVVRGEDGGIYTIPHPVTGATMTVIASYGFGWDHVSVSLPDRCPTWEEMDFVKQVFFFEFETVMQLHVPRRAHVNNHPYCLHLWKPHDARIPRPPAEMVGLTDVGDLLAAVV